jgi:hypothetical protein
LQIQRIPYGTLSSVSMIVDRKLFAISMSTFKRGAIIPCTSLFAAAASAPTPRGKSGGSEPVSSSICVIICS